VGRRRFMLSISSSRGKKKGTPSPSFGHEKVAKKNWAFPASLLKAQAEGKRGKPSDALV